MSCGATVCLPSLPDHPPSSRLFFTAFWPISANATAAERRARPRRVPPAGDDAASRGPGRAGSPPARELDGTAAAALLFVPAAPPASRTRGSPQRADRGNRRQPSPARAAVAQASQAGSGDAADAAEAADLAGNARSMLAYLSSAAIEAAFPSTWNAFSTTPATLDEGGYTILRRWPSTIQGFLARWRCCASRCFASRSTGHDGRSARRRRRLRLDKLAVRLYALPAR